MGGGSGDATKRYLDEEEVGGGEGRMLLKDTWTRRRLEEGREGCY